MLYLIPLIIIGLIYYPPRFLLRYLHSEVLFYSESREQKIALTIDDAPTAQTEVILEILKKYQVTATFFIIGGQVQDSTILQKIVAAGHELGNHTMWDRASIRLSEAELRSELTQTELILHQATDRVKWFRPGCGYFSSKMIRIAKEYGYRTVLGSVYPHDPAIKSSFINSKYILSKVQAGDIIIIHDRPWTPQLLEIILPQLIQKYQVGTLSQLTN